MIQQPSTMFWEHKNHLVTILTGPFCFITSIGAFMVANIVGFSWYIILFASCSLFIIGMDKYKTFLVNYLDENYGDS
jgi:hypothetical protein